jgi:recombination protein RecA
MTSKKKISETKTNSKVDNAVNSDLRKRMEAANAKLNKIIQKDNLPVIDDEVEGSQDLSIPLFSTGILALDRALSGGMPMGRITELYGEEGSGKSLISLMAIAETQKNGGRCLLFDAESSYDPIWAAKLGVNTKELMVSDANIAEDVFKIIQTYAEEKLVNLVVIDSIASLTTLDIMNSELGAAKYASLAGVLSRILPVLLKYLKRSNVSLIVVNQVRDAIGSYTPMLRTPGGRSLKHLYHTRIKVFKAGSSKLLKDGDTVRGVEIETQVTKHRGGPNYLGATFRIDYNNGFDYVYDLVSFLLATGHITKNGAFYTYSNQKYQGLENLMDAFRKDPAAFKAGIEFAKEILKSEAGNKNVIPSVPTDKDLVEPIDVSGDNDESND